MSNRTVMARSFEARSTLWAALGFLAVVVGLLHRLFLGEALSPAANLWMDVPFRSVATQDLTPYLNGIQGDAWRACEPWHIYQYNSARAGRFPLWNPHVFCGFPFHANAQAAMLSPFHWIYFLANPKWATGIVAALKLWVTGFATYCLGRRLQMSPLGAFLAGTAWMLSAFNVRWLLWPLASATAWLPIVLLALEVLVQQPSWRKLALAGFATSGLQLSGHPECQFLVAALSGLYVLLRVIWSRAGGLEKIRLISLGFAAHILGLLGAAVALLPFMEQMRNSVDWHESTHAVHRYLPVEGLLGAIAPDHFGRPRAGRIYFIDRLPVNYIEAGLYVGLVPLVLAASAVTRLISCPRRTVHDTAGGVAAIFAVWIALCAPIVLGVPGFTHVVHNLPLFSKVDTLRLLFAIQFAMAMLAGIGWTWISQKSDRVLQWFLPAWCIGISLVLAGVLLMPDMPHLYSHREGLRVLLTDPSTPSPLEHRSLRTLASLIFAILGFGWSMLCVRFVRNPELKDVPRGIRTGLLVLVLADLGWVAYGFNPTMPVQFVFPDPPESLRRVAANVGDGRVIATDEILAPNLAIVYGLRDIRGYDFPIDPYWATLFRRLGWIGSQVGMTLLPRNQVIPCMPSMLQSVLDKSAVRFIYTNVRRDKLVICSEDQEGLDEQAGWPLVQAGPGEDAVYQNPTSYPRAYFADGVSVADSNTALDAMLDIAHDLRKQSFVEDLVGTLQATEASPGTVTFEQDGAEEVVLRTQSVAPALLVLSDRYDSSWRVEIDGRPAQALRANSLFRGVVVPGGDHVVRWTYRPASFMAGMGISAVTVAMMLGVLLVRRSS